jgi:hypothetical protein
MTRTRSRRPYPALRVLLLAVAATFVCAGAAAAVVLVTMLLALLGLGAVLFVVARHRRRVRARQRGSIPPPRRAVPQWRAAHLRFAQLRGEYAAYECDPLAVLRLPALADVTVPATARFVDSFAQAQALDSDREPPPEHAAAYCRAVDRARRSWQAARDAAERIRLAGLSPDERSSVERAIKLLTMARDSGHDAERQAAYAKARAELAKLERTGRLRLPRAARAALDESARAGLTAGLTTGSGCQPHAAAPDRVGARPAR